ncbi:hypothetical protein H7A76_23025 [Pseudomonas sp. MSSRFD41]|uniref:hypothetical protein n=1 Tax=unclassified Pseudomonas TaxID=196821 RepID=UPI0012FE9817|nr:MULTISPECIES: hypothetical protein [unclassified Pseudomonas]MBC2658324.1 hypothetical protein [Pseudomonas sp. MSSRFD41]
MSDKQSYDTLVVEGMGNSIPREIGGLRVAAWSSGNALHHMSELEDFVRELSYGDIEDPQQAAIELMERGGWG